MPTGRFEVRGAALNGRIYAAGGQTAGEGVTIDTVEEYDPTHDSWRSLPPLPEPRWGVGITAIDGRLFVFGGSPDAVGSTPASNKVWE